jgi:D-alanyl-lipoteichoic acid acyltransferase DltB (MBOAT superfamily)
VPSLTGSSRRLIRLVLFNSLEFIFGFVPICLAGFVLLVRAGKSELALNWLTLMSFVFYGWWNPAYLPLIVGSMAMNFAIARLIATRPGRSWLAAGVAANLGVLGLFKYADFLVGNVNLMLRLDLALPALVLPLAISFFTFTQIALLVDVHRKRIAAPGIRDHLLFVLFFPHLIAGPIVHFRELMPQLVRQTTRAINRPRAIAGLTLFLVGLFKKVVIADSIGPWASTVFSGAAAGHALSTADAWIGAAAYTFQIYFDFSGYCDMSIGLANLFGVRLPVNFYSPYKASSIIEFWRRWHMTLSRFLRDYLYIPLGGNRHGRQVRNLMLTMLLGGLWHGANWTFVAWGGLHGFYLLVNHAWRRHSIGARLPKLGAIGRAAGWALTFLCVIVGWVVFRADSLHTATAMLSSMFLPQPGNAEPGLFAFDSLPWRAGLLACLLPLMWLPNALELSHPGRLGLPVSSTLRRSSAERMGATVPLLAIRLVCYAAFVVHVVIAGPNPPSEFLYFNF